MNALLSKVPLGIYEIPKALNTILDHGFQIFDTISQDEAQRLEHTRFLNNLL